MGTGGGGRAAEGMGRVHEPDTQAIAPSRHPVTSLPPSLPPFPCAGAPGTVSYWSGANRVPATTDATTAQSCAVCADNTYAPRKGMQKCLACKAGTQPNTPNGAAGPTECTVCDTNKFRSAFKTDATCTACTDGSEVGPSNHAACTLW